MRYDKCNNRIYFKWILRVKVKKGTLLITPSSSHTVCKNTYFFEDTRLSLFVFSHYFYVDWFWFCPWPWLALVKTAQPIVPKAISLVPAHRLSQSRAVTFGALDSGRNIFRSVCCCFLKWLFSSILLVHLVSTPGQRSCDVVRVGSRLADR